MIVTLETVRAAVVSKLEELRWKLPEPVVIEYDNHPDVNSPSQGSAPYLKVSILWQDGEQLGLSDIQPGHRLQGVLVLEALAREGAGMKKVYELLDGMYPELQMSSCMYPVKTQAARPASRPTVSGWMGAAMVIPFWAESFT